MQIIAPRHTFDVIVVGSGASGGWAAKRLAEAGVKVALVDAGRPLTDAAYSEHMRPFELKYRDKAHELIRRTRPVCGRGRFTAPRTHVTGRRTRMTRR
jgi:choline dehydrogenase-like flavoprotein